MRDNWLRRPKRTGTTLAEVLVSMLLVSVVLLGAMESLHSTLMALQQRDQLTLGRLLADSLLAEALAMPYQDLDQSSTVEFGIESDETSNPTNRSEFDDLDDYHGWSSAPERRDGTPLPGTAGWTRAVTVERLRWDEWTSSGGEEDEGEGGSDEGFRRVTVTVTDPDGRTLSRAGFRATDGALEQPLATSQQTVAAVSVTLAVGDHELDATVAVPNHATGP